MNNSQNDNGVTNVTPPAEYTPNNGMSTTNQYNNGKMFYESN